MFISKTLKIFVVALVVASVPVAALAVPQLPHLFYGTIIINGNPASVGTVIIAKVGGVEKGRITTTTTGTYGGPGAYDQKLLVQGSDLVLGNTITFTVFGVNGTPTASFESGKVEEKNLEFTQVIILPVASPVAGTYTSAQSVTLTANGSSSIYYTTNGSTPTCSTGTVYSGAISVGSSQTIEAISCYLNNNSSTVVSFAYTINIPITTTSSSGGGGGGGGNTTSGGTSGGSTTATVTTTLSAAAQKVDANKDNKIDVLDFNTLMVNWGKTTANNVADFNSDGKVDIFDFNLLMINWTK